MFYCTATGIRVPATCAGISLQNLPYIPPSLEEQKSNRFGY